MVAIMARSYSRTSGHTRAERVISTSLSVDSSASATSSSNAASR